MFYQEKENSAINQALKTLQSAQQIKKEELNQWREQSASLRGLMFSQVSDAMASRLQLAQNFLKESERISKIIFVKMQQEIEQNPWALLGKVAVGSFGLGVILAQLITVRKRAKK